MSETDNIQQNNEQLLNDIQSLQTMEQQLFSSLENDPNLTTEQQEKIIEKMNQLSNMRVNLYQTLSGLTDYYKNSLNSSQEILKDQTTTIYIVENELNKSKKRLEILNTEKNNKIRLVEINNYYGDKYAEHSDLMKIVILTLVPIIILALLNNHDLLPDIIYYGLTAIIAAIGGYFFWIRFGSIITRDNMNYQTYDWNFDPSQAPASSSTTSDDPWSSGTSSSYGSCIGDACCSSGLIYDYSLNQCVVSTSTPTTTTSPTTTTTSTSSSTASS
jgi:hypothetical protein